MTLTEEELENKEEMEIKRKRVALNDEIIKQNGGLPEIKFLWNIKLFNTLFRLELKFTFNCQPITLIIKKL